MTVTNDLPEVVSAADVEFHLDVFYKVIFLFRNIEQTITMDRVSGYTCMDIHNKFFMSNNKNLCLQNKQGTTTIDLSQVRLISYGMID